MYKISSLNDTLKSWPIMVPDISKRSSKKVQPHGKESVSHALGTAGLSGG